MKVLITTDCYTPTVNGVVTSVKNLKSELTKRGHEVRILTLSNSLLSWERDGVVSGIPQCRKNLPRCPAFPESGQQIHRRDFGVETGNCAFPKANSVPFPLHVKFHRNCMFRWFIPTTPFMRIILITSRLWKNGEDNGYTVYPCSSKTYKLRHRTNPQSVFPSQRIRYHAGGQGDSHRHRPEPFQNCHHRKRKKGR